MAEHQRIAALAAVRNLLRTAELCAQRTWKPLQAQRFPRPFPRLWRRCSRNWLFRVDLHHDNQCNRPAGSFTSRKNGNQWTRMATLRLLPEARLKRDCAVASCGNPAVPASINTNPKKWVAVATGAAPAVSSLTRRRVCCFSSRPRNWMQGLELHQPGRAYETCLSTGSPCRRKRKRRAEAGAGTAGRHRHLKLQPLASAPHARFGNGVVSR
jgi:hypothetical protein